MARHDDDGSTARPLTLLILGGSLWHMIADSYRHLALNRGRVIGSGFLLNLCYRETKLYRRSDLSFRVVTHLLSLSIKIAFRGICAHRHFQRIGRPRQRGDYCPANSLNFETGGRLA